MAAPEKLFFKIGEVAQLIGVEPHVLRYWETEFHLLRPMKTRGAHRVYRRRDVEIAKIIRRLLRDERYTVPGAKKKLREVLQSGPKEMEPELEKFHEAFDTRGDDARESRVSEIDRAERVALTPLSVVAQVAAPVPASIEIPRAAPGMRPADASEFASLRAQLSGLLDRLPRVTPKRVEARPSVAPSRVSIVALEP